MNQSVCGSMADGGDDEVMLELSIGGIFGKPKKSTRTVSESVEKGERIGDFNVQSKDSKRKKSVDFGSCGSVSGPFVENKEWLESQVVRRNAEPVCKKEKVGNVPEKVGLVDGDLNCVFRQTVCRSFGRYEGNVNRKFKEDEIDDGGGGGSGGGGWRCYSKGNSNGCGSSAYSDGHCSDHRGGGTDDSRSNSNNSQSQLDQQPASTSTASIEPFDPSDQPTGSPKQTISTTKSPDPTIMSPNAQSNPHEPTSTSHHQQASLLARMPCVSTTGNGPNGRTVSGFLYRYTKHDVSIVCVCHGRSFSPAGFVEHAGGVDIAHPLKHITIYPAAFAS